MVVSSRRDSDPIPHGTQRSKRWAKLCRPSGTRSFSVATPDLRPGITYSALGAGDSGYRLIASCEARRRQARAVHCELHP